MGSENISRGRGRRFKLFISFCLSRESLIIWSEDVSSVAAARFSASTFFRAEKQPVMWIIQCKQEGVCLMVWLAFFCENISSPPSSLPLPPTPFSGIKTGGVFPFCQSHSLSLRGLSLYQCKQKTGNSVWCFLLSKNLLLVSLWSWALE